MEPPAETIPSLAAAQFWARAGGTQDMLRGFTHCCTGRLQTPRSIRTVEATDRSDPRLVLTDSNRTLDLEGAYRLLFEVESATGAPTELVLVVLTTDGEFVPQWVEWTFRLDSQTEYRGLLNPRPPDFSQSAPGVREGQASGRRDYLAALQFVQILERGDGPSQRAAALLRGAIETLRRQQLADAQIGAIARAKAPAPAPPARYPGKVTPCLPRR